jgi:hypothetical protein
MFGAGDDQEPLVARSCAIHGTRVVDVWRVLTRGDEERRHTHSRHRTPGGETLEIARPGKACDAADSRVPTCSDEDSGPAHRRPGEGDRFGSLTPELSDGSEYVAVEIARTRKVEGEDAHSAGGEPLGERQPGAKVAMELVCEDDASRAVADDDPLEVGGAEVDDLRGRVLVGATVERLPRGCCRRRRRACFSRPGRSATGASAAGERKSSECNDDDGPPCPLSESRERHLTNGRSKAVRVHLRRGAPPLGAAIPIRAHRIPPARRWTSIDERLSTVSQALKACYACARALSKPGAYLATAGVLAAVSARVARARPHHAAAALGALDRVFPGVEERRLTGR